MEWDVNADIRINTQALKYASPDAVYEALESLGRLVRAGTARLGDATSMERTLLRRGDPVIALALAKHASSASTLNTLWAFASRTPPQTTLSLVVPGEVAEHAPEAHPAWSDPEFARAVKLAALANDIADGVLGRDITSFPRSEDVRQIALGKDNDLVGALMCNHSKRPLLAELFKRSGAFEDLDDEQFRRLVQYATHNKCINDRYEERSGLDAVGHAIEDGIWNLVQTAPVTAEWVTTLHRLLLEIRPEAAARPRSASDIAAALKRWNELVDRDETPRGYYTEHSVTQELRCLIGMLYGLPADSQGQRLGSPSDSDAALRCAFYATELLNRSNFDEFLRKDGDLFLFAAVANLALLRSHERRSMLQETVHGDIELLLNRNISPRTNVDSRKQAQTRAQG
jgi:hypothetical protein